MEKRIYTKDELALYYLTDLIKDHTGAIKDGFAVYAIELSGAIQAKMTEFNAS